MVTAITTTGDDMSKRTNLLTLAAVLGLVAGVPGIPTASAADAIYAGPTPDVPCDAQSHPETTQGRVSLTDVNDGRAAMGYTCNSYEVGHFGATGGFRVERYVDKAGHECAYFDSTLLFPKDVAFQGAEGPGTYVMDMSDPANPVLTDTLKTPAMESPHESLRLNQKRGLLAADMGYPTANPGFVDIYDVTADCRHPVLDSSSPMGILGHESGFAPDGNTFYVSSLYAHTLDAVDVSNPLLPVVIWASADYEPHGVTISDDGNRMYMADNSGPNGLTILDTTAIQNRTVAPNAVLPVISRTTWPEVSTPQNATPFTENGHRYVMENDEYGSGATVGAGRIIDVQDETHPFVVSNLRLEVNQADAQAGDQTNDPGASGQFQGYRAHYCTLPTRVNPTYMACSFIDSGLRVFDISDVVHPQEIAYFNGPVVPNVTGATSQTEGQMGGAFAMSAPTYVPERNEIWYSDGNLGFFVVRLTPNAKRSAAAAVVNASATTTTRAAAPATAPATATASAPSLANTGLNHWPGIVAGLSLGGAVLVRRRVRRA